MLSTFESSLSACLNQAFHILFRIGMGFGYLQKILFQTKECRHDFRLKMFAALCRDNLDTLTMGKRTFVTTPGAERIIHVHQGHQAGREWNLFSCKTLWITLSIPLLVMGQSDFQGNIDKRGKGNFFPGLFKNFCPVLGMLLHPDKFIGVRGPGFFRIRSGTPTLPISCSGAALTIWLIFSLLSWSLKSG